MKIAELMKEEKDFSLIRNLNNAGCGPLPIEKILALHEIGNIREELRLPDGSSTFQTAEERSCSAEKKSIV